MDPKMDSGFLAEGESHEDEFDVLRVLLPEEVVGLMDQMLCYEVSARHPDATTIGSDISDADLRVPRWHGTWVIRSQRPYLRLTISTGCCGLSPKRWKTLALTGPIMPESTTKGIPCFTSYFEHTL